MSQHFRVPGRLLLKLQELGVRPDLILRTAGLPPDLFNQPRVLLTTEQLFAFWQAITSVSSDPSIGLKVGTETKPEQLDPIALAALSAPSFGDALRHIARYKQLSCPEEIRHEIEADELSIQFRWTRAVEVEPSALTDLCYAWILTIARQGTGTRIVPVRIEYMGSRSYRRILEGHFGCPIVLGAARNAIVFRASDATRPFVTSNADLLAILAPQLDEELRQHVGQNTFPERVRATIQKKLTGRRPKMREVARDLHMSARTLQRRLQDTGSSFQQILEEARHQLARYYLRNSVLELTEAAYLLGYEDANSFVRAFRTWEGVPPAHWRECQRGQVAS